MATAQPLLAQLNLRPLDVEQLKAEAAKPFFAAAGATGLALDFALGYAVEAQKSYLKRIEALQSRVAKVDYRDPRSLQGQARVLVNSRFEELTREARQAQARFETRVAELQKDARAFPNRVQAQVNEAFEELTSAYADLAVRGEKLVAAVRKDGVRAVTTPAAKPATKPATKPAAKPATKSAAKSAASRSTGTAKRSTAKPSTAKRTTTKRTTKSGSTRSTARKSTTATARSTAKSTPQTSA